MLETQDAVFVGCKRDCNGIPEVVPNQKKSVGQMEGCRREERNIEPRRKVFVIFLVALRKIPDQGKVPLGSYCENVLYQGGEGMMTWA